MAIQFSGLASGLDTDAIIKDLMNAERMKVEKIQKQKTKLEWKKDIWQDMNSKLYSFFTKHVYALKSSGTYMKKNAYSSNEVAISAKATIKATNGNHTITVNRLAKGSFLTGNKIELDKNGAAITSTSLAEELIDFGGVTKKTISISLDNGTTYTDIEIEKTDSIASVVKKIKENVEGVNVSFDDNFNRLMMSTKKQGDGNQIVVAGDDTLLTGLGLLAGNRTGTIGEDAEFVYNTTTLTSSSNEVTIDGLTLTLKAEGVTANISVNQDSEAIYDNVKEFVTEYNKLLTEINEKIYADKATGYEPLTQEEKKAMSEDEVKLYEEKIKKSLLRRDSILFRLRDSMRNILTNSSGIDTTGFTYSHLLDLGIVTGDYKEKGILHINGDEDDALYAPKKNALKEAIENDPEKVSELLNALGDKLYSTMQEKMKSTKVSSALTFFSDKLMTEDIDDYKDKISELEERLIQVEQRYYRQFTAMEQAIQAMNNQSASLASMLGGGA
ncbi:flagellar filament capping protein FliD [Vallitalea pronyensis]|uniref:Flagellar hook-associated protein 2 n=1 Tax=Vallitalea pronyensis TaxID=1348613 RepID=A0A8J8MHR3_9FIRM|nr:flagellar filament capping protein FliD [Vallitalea pronyensis]QUI21458.1 flagellar filament capping protein FliD [Vallitalea pronyensis]